MPEHERTIEAAFTAQAEGYDSSPATNATGILDTIAELADPRADQAWLDAACGTGIVSRRLAPHVRGVQGLDLTPQMLELARRSTTAAGLANVAFQLGDATATGLPDSSVDGAVTRFSLHHIPAPGRVLEELARVVRPGGRIVIADLIADEDRAAFAWTAQIDRLRDPAHWASLTPDELRGMGAQAGLTLAAERLHPFAIDFEEWLARGTSDPDAHALVERLLAQRPRGTERFVLDGPAGERTLGLQIWIGAWEAG